LFNKPEPFEHFYIKPHIRIILLLDHMVLYRRRRFINPTHTHCVYSFIKIYPRVMEEMSFKGFSIYSSAAILFSRPEPFPWVSSTNYCAVQDKMSFYTFFYFYHWQPSYSTNRNHLSDLNKSPSKDHSCIVSSKSTEMSFKGLLF
jgi:hypothetical protein